eukprot:1586230-Rhodomonas_salina.1
MALFFAVGKPLPGLHPLFNRFNRRPHVPLSCSHVRKASARCWRMSGTDIAYGTSRGRSALCDPSQTANRETKHEPTPGVRYWGSVQRYSCGVMGERMWYSCAAVGERLFVYGGTDAAQVRPAPSFFWRQCSYLWRRCCCRWGRCGH